jgi:hypothetical protein
MLGPTVWGKVLGMGAAVFPIDFPTIITLPAAVIVRWLVSLADNSAAAKNERLAFEDEYIRSQTGLGAEGGRGALIPPRGQFTGWMTGYRGLPLRRGALRWKPVSTFGGPSDLSGWRAVSAGSRTEAALLAHSKADSSVG